MDILHSVHGYNHIQNEYNVIRIIRYEYDAFQSNYSFERIVVNKRMNNMDQKKKKKSPNLKSYPIIRSGFLKVERVKRLQING